MPLLELLSLPFMQRALAAGVMLAAMLAGLGVFVTLRKMAFFGDGIAHSSLAGIAIAVVTGLSPLPIALIWSVLIALAIWRLERTTRLPSDTLIGIFFTASMALGVTIMSFAKGYRPELLTYLFGSILAVRTTDLALIAIVGVAILIWLVASARQLVYMSLAEENAIVSGIPTTVQSATLYVALAVSAVLGVKVLGIILVSAILIIPAATSRMLTQSFKGYVWMAIAVSETTMIAGIAISAFYDLPSGAAVILIGTFAFFLAAILRRFATR